jgi:hypothetical protein
MFTLALLCLFAGIFPGFVIDGLAPAVGQLVGAHMPVQGVSPWLSIVPISESRSSYIGLVVFAFIAATASIAAFAIHRLASRAVWRAPAWDCGFPDASPVTQYTAGSFAQPIRRVFGTTVFHARERVDMPAPGDMRPAHFSVELRDLVWDTLYQPVAGGLAVVSERLNRYQFLTIRRYLSIVFLSLVGLLLVLALWE